jgi:hypothetical protein
VRAQYDQENGPGSAKALFGKENGVVGTLSEQNVILSTLLGAPYAKELRIQLDSQRGTGSADNLFAKLGIVAPAPKAALAPVAAARPLPTMPARPTNSQLKSARARLANYFDNQLAKADRPGT